MYDESRHERRHKRHHHERPERPTRLATLHNRIDQEKENQRCKADAEKIQRRPSETPRFLDCSHSDDDRNESYRNVHKKYRPPRPPENIQTNQQAPDKLGYDRGKPHRSSIEPNRKGLLLSSDLDPNNGQDLGGHQSGRHALKNSRSD